MTGKFITFEGVEGAGKTSQIDILRTRLEGLGMGVICVREPGGTALGEVIRGLLQSDDSNEPISPETELLLFEASRAHLVNNVIKPGLECGKYVLCDRFIDSTTAYQGFGRGLDVDEIIRLNSLAVSKVMPDLTLFLQLDIRAGMNRINERNNTAGTELDRIERAGQDFHSRVNAGFLSVAEMNPERVKTIEASGSMETVAESVWKEVEPFLKTAGVLV